ncbi:glycoside hydrolase superfamily [Leptodontidium sp. 2 PMI_412]|nr:glycoside hydrolase superfamily [Leptodontidium sp. 2 PMI_412]
MMLSLKNPSLRGLSLFYIALPFISFYYSPISASTAYDPFSLLSRCPPPCQSSSDHGDWGIYRDTSQLASCNQTILLDLNLNHGLDSESLSSPIRALTSALAQIVRAQRNSGKTIVFAMSGKAIAGAYAGSQIDDAGFGSIIQQLAGRETIHQRSHTSTVAQLCGSESLGSQILGVFIDRTGDLDAVKAALGGWNNATCLTQGQGETETWPAVVAKLVSGKTIPVGPEYGGTPGNIGVDIRDSSNDNSNLDKRATCKYTQAVSGDGCWSVADRCAVTQAQLISYNNDAKLCSNLKVGQYICCSAGTLPNFTPQPNSDGTRKSYTVKSNDYCAAIAASNTMTVADIESRNKNTWGWTGCSYLLVGAVICLSAGSPPMPGAVTNAVCGPTVKGTSRPADMSTLANLNPCPLNVCCNVWGQCGTTKDFCIPNPADTGAPGTAKPGTNGCISGCNLAIMNNASPPTSFKKIGYWEAWNSDRPCLHMKASQIDTSKYTHLISVGNLTGAFADFKALTGVKRIVSFGGCSFSTDYDTFPIFRAGVTAAQRQAVAAKVVAFVINNRLDGVGFDWEYPGAPDIPGISPGSPEDGTNYLAFLKLVRAALSSDNSVGLAAPASYWYLKGFPIAEMSKVVDYIVYMTYDLHGQWDYGNAWSDDGCPAGNCLRSHVNMTETKGAMAMITHAGVQASKVIVGMVLYGRSFKMTTPGCYGQDCTYVGKDSGATPGRCTGTTGYISNFEIRDIIETVGNAQQYRSDEGDILVYNSVQWVSWMTRDKYDGRISWVKSLNFGGTVDWAIDLDADYGSNDAPGQGNTGSEFKVVNLA